MITFIILIIKPLITNDKMLVFLSSHTVMFICAKHYTGHSLGHSLV